MLSCVLHASSAGKLINVVDELRVTSIVSKAVALTWGMLATILLSVYTAGALCSNRATAQFSGRAELEVSSTADYLKAPEMLRTSAGLTARTTSANFATSIQSVADLPNMQVRRCHHGAAWVPGHTWWRRTASCVAVRSRRAPPQRAGGHADLRHALLLAVRVDRGAAGALQLGRRRGGHAGPAAGAQQHAGRARDGRRVVSALRGETRVHARARWASCDASHAGHAQQPGCVLPARAPRVSYHLSDRCDVHVIGTVVQ